MTGSRSTDADTELPMKHCRCAFRRGSRPVDIGGPLERDPRPQRHCRHAEGTIDHRQLANGVVGVAGDGDTTTRGEKEVGQRLTRRERRDIELLWIDAQRFHRSPAPTTSAP